MKNSIKAPVHNGKEWTVQELNYDDVFKSFKKSVDKMPVIIAELQKADEEKWGKLFEELSQYAQDDVRLSKIIRMEKDGLHIGEQSWAVRLVVTAFMYGYSVGSACYKAGHCDYTTYVS